MSRYSLKQTAALLSTGRTTLCRDLREMGMLDGNNLGTREHTRAGRLVVELREFAHVGMGESRAYGKTFVTDKGLRYIAQRMGRDIVTQRGAANDAEH